MVRPPPRRRPFPDFPLTMSLSGYSDRINHALAFAAKHHDQQVRKGTRLPYSTHAANLAVILTRYGCPDDVVVAGILLDVVRDWVRDGVDAAVLAERIGGKFGGEPLAMAMEVAERRVDDDGVELSAEDRRAALLYRIGGASPGAQWVCAADAVHAVHVVLSDLRRTAFPETVWGRQPLGREGTVAWYAAVADRLGAAGPCGAAVAELREGLARLAE